MLGLALVAADGDEVGDDDGGDDARSEPSEPRGRIGRRDDGNGGDDDKEEADEDAEKTGPVGRHGSSRAGRSFTESITASAPAPSYARRPDSPVRPPVRTPIPW